MGYIFISYSSENRTSADAFRQICEKNGIQTWMAPYDLQDSSLYAEEITKAIRECSFFALLLSNDSQESVPVSKEVHLAVLGFKKDVITIKIEDVVLNDAFAFYLDNTHIAQVNEIDENSPDIKRILDVVRKHTGSKHLKVVDEDDNVYQGSFADGKITGEGKKICTNGDVYEGFFVDGVLNGKGKAIFADGHVYEGTFVDDKLTGKGKLKLVNGAVYEGDFFEDHPTGKGKIMWPAGDVYEGDFADGMRTGKGRYTWSNGDVYEGDFVNNEITGKGRLTLANGVVREGEFVEGKLVKKGRWPFSKK